MDIIRSSLNCSQSIEIIFQRLIPREHITPQAGVTFKLAKIRSEATGASLKLSR